METYISVDELLLVGFWEQREIDATFVGHPSVKVNRLAM